LRVSECFDQFQRVLLVLKLAAKKETGGCQANVPLPANLLTLFPQAIGCVRKALVINAVNRWQQFVFSNSMRPVELPVLFADVETGRILPHQPAVQPSLPSRTLAKIIGFTPHQAGSTQALASPQGLEAGFDHPTIDNHCIRLQCLQYFKYAWGVATT